MLLTGAASAQAEPALLLDLPPQDLEHALQAYSRATGMAVLVDRELTRGRRSIGVHGRFTAQEALAMLLTGSGLMARYARSDAFTLQVPEVSHTPERRNAARINNSYATALQQAIEASLCRSPLTRPGSYRAVLQVWVGRDGVVQHNRLVTSTGDVRRDNALVESFRNLTIDRPTPSALRQPVTLLLLPESSGKRMECTRWEGVSGG